MKLVTCACGHQAMRPTGEINRAAKRGWPLWCSRACAGAARRLKNPPSDEERREAKAAYDAAYREKNRAALKAKKAAHYAATADREKEAAYRRANMARHVEYCRRPEYREKKAVYDQQRRDQQMYGAFASSAAILRMVETEVLSRATRYEIDQQNDRLNKATKRKRAYEQSTVCR